MPEISTALQHELVHLTARERQLFDALSAADGWVDIGRLTRQIYRFTSPAESAALRMTLYRLRRKLAASEAPFVIETSYAAHRTFGALRLRWVQS